MIISDIKEFFSFLKPSNIKGWFDVENLFINYFWLYTIDAFAYLVLNIHLIYSAIFPLVLYLMFFRRHLGKSINIIDLLWFLSLIWSVSTWFFNDYQQKPFLIIRCFTQEIAYMIAYWIVRYSERDYLQIIINKASKPLVITALIGLYCFFLEPSWYVNMINEGYEQTFNRNSVDKESILELYRLRSIFSSPYPLAYMGAYALILEAFYFAKVNKNDVCLKNHIAFTILIVITSVLCMMRAPLLGAIIGMVCSYIYNVKYMRGRILNRWVVYSICILITTIVIFTSSVDTSLVDFVISKVEVFGDKDNNFIEKRLFLGMQSLSLAGEGFGKYNIVAQYKFGLPSIADGEYMKIIAEQGFVGLGILLLVFVAGLIKSFANFKILHLEFCILSMLMICMIGANPLSTHNKHCFIFWLALGQVARYKSKKYGNITSIKKS